MNLSEEQKEEIRKKQSEISDLILLTRAVFNDDSLDGRTKEGRAVRQFLVQEKLDFSTTKKEKKEKIQFSEEQEEFIINHARDGGSAYDIAKILFPEVNISNLSKEVIDVAEYIRNTDISLLRDSEAGLVKEYFAPKTRTKMVKKINLYCHEEINEEKMTREYMDNADNCIKFLGAPRFIQVINTYSAMDDRNLFEAEYIRSVWDKPDLTSDELNLYINVCMDYIHLKNISKAIDKLNRMFEECEDQRDMTVRLAELLKTKSEEYNQCEKRQEALIARLNGDRKERIKNKHKDNASIISLVKLFQNEEDRKRMVDIANKQNLLVLDEANNIENMGAWKARVLGISKNDAI
jgi:hypothetical protein